MAGKFSGEGAVNLGAVNPNPRCSNGAVTWSRRQAAGGSWRCSPATGELRHRARRAWMNSVGARRGPPLFCLMCVAPLGPHHLQVVSPSRLVERPHRPSGCTPSLLKKPNLKLYHSQAGEVSLPTSNPQFLPHR